MIKDAFFLHMDIFVYRISDDSISNIFYVSRILYEYITCFSHTSTLYLRRDLYHLVRS